MHQLPARAGGRTLKPIHLFWLAAALALIADLASKEVVFSALGGVPEDGMYTAGHMLWLLPDAFRLICHYNTGGAFGLASGKLFLFLGATAVLAPALVLTAYHTREPDAPLWGLGLIVGGAAGNLYDRLFFKPVADFQHRRHRHRPRRRRVFHLDRAGHAAQKESAPWQLKTSSP